jgi:hypothetical protein
MRDAKGRFAKGNAGGPGRPSRRTEAEYLLALSEAVSLEDWKKIVATAKEAAIDGDHQSRLWLGRYLIGEPQPGENEANNEAAELLEQRLAVIESHLRPLRLVDERYPTEELARMAAQRLIALDGARIVGNLPSNKEGPDQ